MRLYGTRGNTLVPMDSVGSSYEPIGLEAVEQDGRWRWKYKSTTGGVYDCGKQDYPTRWSALSAGRIWLQIRRVSR
jgi:hypothetical protein